MSYKETYYVIGFPEDSNETFMECIECRYDTLEEAKRQVDRLVGYFGCSHEEYDIAKITTVMERGIK